MFSYTDQNQLGFKFCYNRESNYDVKVLMKKDDKQDYQEEVKAYVECKEGPIDALKVTSPRDSYLSLNLRSMSTSSGGGWSKTVAAAAVRLFLNIFSIFKL